MVWQPSNSSVLVPFDFSDACQEALAVGREFAGSPGSLHVVHVVVPPAPAVPGVMWGELDLDGMRRRAKEELVTAVKAAGVEGAQVEVLMGAPGTRIAEFAREQGCGLIVIPSHGRTGLERWVMGSVSERVVRLAPCPVLVLRDPK